MSRNHIFYKGLMYTFIVLFLGLLFSVMINNYQTNVVNKENEDMRIRVQEINLFAEFIAQNLTDENKCELFYSQMGDYAKIVNEVGRVIEKHYNNQIDLDTIKMLQRDYVIGAIYLYSSIQKYNQICQNNKVNYIIYFYPYNCQTCGGMTYVVSTYINQNSAFELSIPGEIGLKSVDLLKSIYDINQLPALVINDDVFSGSDSYVNAYKYLK